jgi:SAM-dependent methyltransferase
MIRSRGLGLFGRRSQKGTDVSEYRDRVYKYYVSSGQAAAAFDEAALRSRGRFIEPMIARHFPEDRHAQILDLGCGGGEFLYFAQRAGFRNTRGVDISGEQVEAARRLGVERVDQAGLLETLARLAPASQDVVLSMDVLEHLTRDELIPVIDEVHRVLAAGGRWIVNVPNAESPLFGRIRYGDPTHELAFTSGSLRTLLLASGFRSVECFENAPLRNGAKGWLRWLLWQAIRGGLRLYLAAETGDTGRNALFTQNLLAVAFK